MPKKAFLVFLLTLVSFHYSFSQKTAVYTDSESDYKKGIELFEQKKFGASQKKFEAVIKQLGSSTEKNLNTLINAAYYRAVCAYELNQPQAETYFVDLINEYGETPTTRLAYYQLGNIYYANKKFDKALTWYKLVDIYDLSVDQTAEFKFQIGYCYFYKQQFDKAKGYFEEIKNIKNKFYYPANYYYGYICYMDKNFDEALNSFNLVKESQLYTPIVPYYITQIYFLKGGYDDVLLYAVPLLTRTDLKYTNEIRQLVGKSYFNTGEYAEALPYLKEFYDNAKQSTKSDIYQIAFCEYKIKDYPHAISHFLQISSLQDSIGQNSQYLLADCYLKTNNKSSARNAFQNAAKLSFDKKIQEVSAYNYAKLSYELGYQDVAISAFKDFVDNFPSSADALDAKEYLTVLLLSTNNYRDALAIIKTIDNKSPKLKQAYQKVAFNRAVQVYIDKDETGADKLFDESLLNPLDKTLEADAYFWKGEIAFDQKQYTEASNDYLKYIDLNKTAGNSSSGPSLLKANYGIGYSFLKLKNYTSAISYFDKAKTQLTSSTADKDTKAKLSNDIYLRCGDCYFILKNYESAATNYQQVISSIGSGTDYALFQKGMILGLQGRNDEKIKNLQRITNEFPFSLYLDDAMFETANTYFNMGDNDNAILVFNKVLNDFPNSSYQQKAHLQLGLIYFNTQHYDNALDEYKTILSKYPKTPAASEALNQIKQILIARGDSPDILPNIAGVTFEKSTKDSIAYLGAEQNFSNEKYDNALQGFTDYLNAYPNGAFTVQAHYYRAECLANNKDYMHALEDYQWVADKPSSLFSEKAILKTAHLYYNDKKDYAQAYKYYNQLSNVADSKSASLEALQGAMRSAYKINKAEETKAAANKVIATDAATDEDLAEANYYLAKGAFDNSDYTNAYSLFSKVTGLTTAEISAESMYNMALIKFKQHDLKAAENECDKIPKLKPTYDYWIVKSYLLLSDIFVEENDLFNAKSTLESVIANYKGNDDIIPTAKEKLAIVKQKEDDGSKLMQDSTEHNFQMDTLENGTLSLPKDTLSKPK